MTEKRLKYHFELQDKYNVSTEKKMNGLAKILNNSFAWLKPNGIIIATNGNNRNKKNKKGLEEKRKLVRNF